jgi:hypothetical protein
MMIALRALMISAVMTLSCASPQLKSVPPMCHDSCKAVLDARDGQMNKFRILCMAIAYAGARHHDDPNVRREVEEGMRICSYVYRSR